LFALSKDEKSFIATSLVQMTRYTWLGYDKHLYFAVLPNQNGTLSLFLSAVADNVEILSFLEATWLQMLLLIVTLILFLVYNFKLLLDSRKILAITQIFEKFVPRQFLQKIATDGIENIQLGRAESDHVTVLFCDIRSFTSLSESMNPQEILNFLNSYFKHMNQPIAKKEGIIDKYVGDAIMAVFNFPEFDDKYEAERAVEAAIEMQYMLTEYNGFRKKTGYIPISNGTGIHSGSAVFGTVGSTDRMESTVLGDSVNVASRLEGLTKMFKTSIIISDKTQELIQDKNFLSRKLDRVSVVGRNEPMDIFEIFDYQEETIKDATLKTLECFENSVEIYERGDWSEASHGFKECLKHFPEDSAASIYIGRCDMMINNPEVALGWDGITHMKNK
jgi:class 3 adenylate cyclase